MISAIRETLGQTVGGVCEYGVGGWVDSFHLFDSGDLPLKAYGFLPKLLSSKNSSQRPVEVMLALARVITSSIVVRIPSRLRHEVRSGLELSTSCIVHSIAQTRANTLLKGFRPHDSESLVH